VGPGAEEEVFVEHSRVRLRADLEDAELLAYVRLGEARGCAGGYMVERRGAWLIEDVEGDWQNVIGLPIFPLVTRLRARGWRLGPTGPTREHP
jgi:septum formation protein